MQKVGERAVFAIAVMLIVTTLISTTSKFIDWPRWKDGFWSGWAQTIGSTLAVYAAILVSQRQIRADRLMKVRDYETEMLRAMRIAFMAVAEAKNSIAILMNDAFAKDEELKRSALEQLDDSVSTLRAAYGMNLELFMIELVTTARMCALRCRAIKRRPAGVMSDEDRQILVVDAQQIATVHEHMRAILQEAYQRVAHLRDLTSFQRHD